jgi:urease accessory protein
MIAALHIQTHLRNDITYLKKGYCTTPFKIANIREDNREKTLRLMLMSSSPGILDGDEYRLLLELEANTSLHLSTQAYHRLFTMNGSAFQQMDVRLQPGALFHYLPQPSVPHQGSSFKAYNKIFLSRGCTLLWGEVLTCGRKDNGEVFLFTRYHNITEVYINGQLIIKENLLISPATSNLSAMGQLEGFTHQASLICLNEEAEILSIKQLVTGFLSTQTNIAYGITSAPINGILVRILGHKAEQLYNCLLAISQLANIIVAEVG